MNTLRCSGWTWLVLAFLGGCGSSDDGGGVAGSAGASGGGGGDATGGAAGGPVPSAAEQAFLEQYVAVACAALEPGCDAQMLRFDLAGCEAEIGKSVLSDVPAKHAFDEAHAVACLKAAAADGGQADFRDSSSACGQTFPSLGVVPLGGACTHAGECAPFAAGEVSCDAPPSAAPGVIGGTCVGSPVLHLGQACGGVLGFCSSVESLTCLDGTCAKEASACGASGCVVSGAICGGAAAPEPTIAALAAKVCGAMNDCCARYGTTATGCTIFDYPSEAVVNPSGVAACAAYVATFQDVCLANYLFLNTSQCRDLVRTGHAARGAACSGDGDCAPEATSLVSCDEGPGSFSSCIAHTTVALGQPCGAIGTYEVGECAYPDAYCVKSAGADVGACATNPDPPALPAPDPIPKDPTPPDECNP